MVSGKTLIFSCFSLIILWRIVLAKLHLPHSNGILGQGRVFLPDLQVFSRHLQDQIRLRSEGERSLRILLMKHCQSVGLLGAWQKPSTFSCTRTWRAEHSWVLFKLVSSFQLPSKFSILIFLERFFINLAVPS